MYQNGRKKNSRISPSYFLPQSAPHRSRTPHKRAIHGSRIVEYYYTLLSNNKNFPSFTPGLTKRSEKKSRLRKRELAPNLSLSRSRTRLGPERYIQLRPFFYAPRIKNSLSLCLVNSPTRSQSSCFQREFRSPTLSIHDRTLRRERERRIRNRLGRALQGSTQTHTHPTCFAAMEKFNRKKYLQSTLTHGRAQTRKGAHQKKTKKLCSFVAQRAHRKGSGRVGCRGVGKWKRASARGSGNSAEWYSGLRKCANSFGSNVFIATVYVLVWTDFLLSSPQ